MAPGRKLDCFTKVALKVELEQNIKSIQSSANHGANYGAADRPTSLILQHQLRWQHGAVVTCDGFGFESSIKIMLLTAIFSTHLI